jgi:4-methyl-5(b-hydroxyethyl)-thiazole monophosphate biosynthesis
MKARNIMQRILCLLADGFEETEAIATVDVLRRAGCLVDLVSMNDTRSVLSSHKIEVIADRTWDPDLRDYDLLFLPGGQPGTNNLAADPRVLGIVHEFHVQNKWVTAICAAPLVLAKAGILKGKRVTSYPTEKQNEIYKDAIYLENLVVKDGNIITSRGVGTVLDFAYTLVDALGIDSEPLKKAMLFKRNTTQN